MPDSGHEEAGHLSWREGGQVDDLGVALSVSTMKTCGDVERLDLASGSSLTVDM